jgi:hypothetical protein
MNRENLILTIAGILAACLVGCCFIGLLGNLFGDAAPQIERLPTFTTTSLPTDTPTTSPSPTGTPVPTVTPLPTDTPLPTPTDTPLPPPEPPTAAPIAPTAPPTPPTQPSGPVCDCSADLYNCTGEQAISNPQACFDYCMSIGAGDIHSLDGNNDGIACED